MNSDITDTGYGITWEQLLTAEECNRIHALAREYQQTQGMVANGNLDTKIRRSTNTWIPHTEKTSWLYDKVITAVKNINNDIYNFELTGTEVFQYAVYDHKDQGTYDWHNDIAIRNNSIRKLSASVILSDTRDFKGGSFLFAPDGKKFEIEQEQGRIIVFPSWTPHCVTPVLQGTRVSLVLWFHGGRFK